MLQFRQIVLLCQYVSFGKEHSMLMCLCIVEFRGMKETSDECAIWNFRSGVRKSLAMLLMKMSKDLVEDFGVILRQIYYTGRLLLPMSFAHGSKDWREGQDILMGKESARDSFLQQFMTHSDLEDWGSKAAVMSS